MNLTSVGQLEISPEVAHDLLEFCFSNLCFFLGFASHTKSCGSQMLSDAAADHTYRGSKLTASSLPQ